MPVILALGNGGKLEESRGRVIIDCAMDKIENHQDHSGTLHYVRNCVTWLFNEA